MQHPLASAQDPDDTLLSDEVALVQAAQGDAAAFAPLYCRYRDRVYWYLRMRTTTEEDAADLTQHAFIQALAALSRYQQQRGSFATWLFAIVRNTLTDYHRRRQPTMAWDLLPGVLEPADGDDLIAQLVLHEDIARLRNLLAALDVDKRELLALRFVARLTIREIAPLIGKSPAATHKQLTRTILALAKQFEEGARP